MQNPVIKFIIPLGVILISIVFGKFLTETNAFSVLTLLFSIIAIFLTFLNPESGLIFLTFSMLLSPEILIAKLPERELSLRIDDFLLLAVFITFLVYHAINMPKQTFIKTPIDKPLIGMVIMYFVSTGIGIIEGRLRPLPSMFFVLKYLQYFILFWITSNITTDIKTLKKVIIAGAITAFIVCIYAYTLFPTQERVYAPFDYVGDKPGEAGTLGGYLLIVMSMALSFFLNASSKKIRYLSLFLFLFAIPPFIKTLSRASYVAFVGILGTFFIISPKRKASLFALVIAGFLLFPVLSPKLTSAVINRIRNTFTGNVKEVEFGQKFSIEESARYRVLSWKNIFIKWLPKKPFFGHGATGVGLVDAQYPRIVGEFGLVGAAIFLWLIYSIIKYSFLNLKKTTDPFEISLITGFICAFAGLLIQSFGVNTFVIIRIMLPFWVLCALVMLTPFKDRNISLPEKI